MPPLFLRLTFRFLPLSTSHPVASLRGETLIQFHLARADKLTHTHTQTPSFLPEQLPFAVASLLPPEGGLFITLTLLGANRGKCSLFPRWRDTSRWKGIAGCSERTLIICCSISAAFVIVRNYLATFLRMVGWFEQGTGN